MTHRTVIRLSGVLLAAVVLGCNDNNPTDTGTFLAVSPLFWGLDPGETVQLTATMGGQTVPVTWSSSNTALATVSATGLVAGVAGGNVAATAALVSDPTALSSASITVFTLLGTSLNSGTGVPVSSSLARGTTVLYRIFVPAGKTSLTVTIAEGAGATGDVDLYVRRQTPPTLSSYTCASENGGSNEICTIANPASGTWYVLLGLWDPYTGATLTATVAP